VLALQDPTAARPNRRIARALRHRLRTFALRRREKRIGDQIIRNEDAIRERHILELYDEPLAATVEEREPLAYRTQIVTIPLWFELAPRVGELCP
jgi:hypothetical protein